MKKLIVVGVVMAAVLGAAGRNVSVGEYPRLKGEIDDQPRLARAVQAAEGGVVAVPEGEYLLARPLVVTNFASFKLHKNATLKAAAEMDFVVKIDNSPVYRGYERHDFGTFFKGGRIDGDGLAGNTALAVMGSVSRYTDAIVVDYTVGFHFGRGADDLPGRVVFE